MPLSEGAPTLIRANLDELQKGGHPPCAVAAGTLTDAQPEAINQERHALGYLPMVSEVLFPGRHVYNSRVVGDGCAIHDVLDQIAGGMQNPRRDRYGNP